MRERRKGRLLVQKLEDRGGKAKEQKEESLEKEFRQERKERRGRKKEKDPNTFCT